MSNEAAGVLLLALIAFWRELFGLIRLFFTKRERDAEIVVQEATAFEKLMSQNLETQQQLMTTTTTFTQFVMDTRKRTDEREARHAEQIKALEKSLIDSQHELEDTNGKVKNLSELVQKLAIENEGKERTIDSLNGRIAALEASEKQAHRAVIAKDEKITELEKRVRELEAELFRLKAQQQPAPIPVIVASIGATSEPLTAADTREFKDIIAESRGETPDSKPADASAVAGESVTPAPGGSESVGQ